MFLQMAENLEQVVGIRVALRPKRADQASGHSHDPNLRLLVTRFVV